MLPPVVGDRNCELVYDSSAAIELWQDAWDQKFESADACEAMRMENVRRSTAPGRREKILANLRRERDETPPPSKELLRDLRALRRLPEVKRALRERRRHQQRPQFTGCSCPTCLDDWTKTRCIDRIE